MLNISIIVAVSGIILTCIFYLLLSANDAKKLSGISDFFLYCRELKAGGVFGTFYASGMSLATVFIAFFQLAPTFGTQLIWAVIFYPLGHAVLWFFISRISAETDNNTTLHGFLGKKFGSQLITKVASIATCIGFIGVLATEIIIGSTLFRELFPSGKGYWVALIFLTSVVIAYSILGGFKTVVRTDKWQSSFVIILCVLITWLAYIQEDSGAILLSQKEAKGWLLPTTLMINFFLINVPFPLVDMSAWQRVAASRDISAARKGIFTAIIIFVITWFTVLFSAIILSSIYGPGDITGGLVTALISFGNYYSVLGLLFVGICFAALVAAMLSTADTFLIAAGQTISMDIQDKIFFSKIHTRVDAGQSRSPTTFSAIPKKDRIVISNSRKTMLYIALLGMVLAIGLTLMGFKVADLIFAVYGSSLALFPTVICGLVFHDNKNILKKLKGSAILSILFGLISGWGYGLLVVLALNHLPSLQPIVDALNVLPGQPSVYNAPTYAIGVSLITFIIVGFFEYIYKAKNNV